MLGIITGSSGFVGQNILNSHYFKDKFSFICYKRNTNLSDIDSFETCKFILHLAGKAHDLKNNSNPQAYYDANTYLTVNLFDKFLASNTEVFIYMSSVKAVADELNTELFEDFRPKPVTDYGKSKLYAEQYILSKSLPKSKRVYILRPCMIHGVGNKGNLNLLYRIVAKGFPWPLGSFDNKRSFCSIQNLCFIIKELIENNQIPSGVYNIADDNPISTNDLVKLISQTLEKKLFIWNIPKTLVLRLFQLGDLLKLPFNTERLNKLTETYIVSNDKIKNAINKPLPVNSREGLTKTFQSFNH
jgi:nucleoside-diphosphate-sugar epimerase